MQIVKTELDSNDLDIILSESLVDEDDNFYDLTLGKALQEECRKKPLLYCEYMLDMRGPGKKLCSFIGWTEDRVIFNVVGIGTPDTLLDSVPRNPPNGLSAGCLLQNS